MWVMWQKSPTSTEFSVLVLQSVHPHFFLLGGGLNLQPNFQKGGIDRAPISREGVAGKGGGDFFQGVAFFT